MEGNTKDIIRAIGNQIQPWNAKLNNVQLATFERLVAKAIDTDKLTALSLCYSKAMHEDDKAFFKNAIDKILSNKG